MQRNHFKLLCLDREGFRPFSTFKHNTYIKVVDITDEITKQTINKKTHGQYT